VSFYESSRKAVCRCGEEIIVAVLPNQYFLNYGDKDWKSKANQALDQMEIIPEKYKRLFESTFDWLDRRPCVRKRGLGTEFPLTKGQGWIIESLSDSVIYMAYYTIIRYINDHEIKPVQLTPAVFDYVFLGEGDLDKIEKDTKIEKKILKSMNTEFEYWYPNDLRHTAIAHISNHLSFAIFHHAAIFPERHWLKKITLNELLIREGEKMSKSGGNTIPIAYLPEQYSVDVTRLYLASAGSSDTVLNWTEEGIKTLVSRLRKFWTVASSIIDTHPLKSLELNNTSFMTRAFVSACTQHLNNAVKELESYDGRSYIANGFHFMLREVEFYLKTSIGLSEEEKNFALGSIIDPWVTVLCPVIPHICEDLNEKLGNLGFCSLKNMPSFESPVVGIDLSKQISFVNNTVDDIKSIIELKRAAPSSISIFFASEWKQELFEAISDIIGEGAFSIGKVMGQLKKNSKFTPKMKNIAKELKNIKDESKVFRQKFLGPQKELEAIEGYKTYLASLFNCPVNAFIAESGKFDDPLNRAQRAQPNKPAIYIKF
jgi:leucyl-tRNA synthetase